MWVGNSHTNLAWASDPCVGLRGFSCFPEMSLTLPGLWTSCNKVCWSAVDHTVSLRVSCLAYLFNQYVVGIRYTPGCVLDSGSVKREQSLPDCADILLPVNVYAVASSPGFQSPHPVNSSSQPQPSIHPPVLLAILCFSRCIWVWMFGEVTKPIWVPSSVMCKLHPCILGRHPCIAKCRVECPPGCVVMRGEWTSAERGWRRSTMQMSSPSPFNSPPPSDTQHRREPSTSSFSLSCYLMFLPYLTLISWPCLNS